MTSRTSDADPVATRTRTRPGRGLALLAAGGAAWLVVVILQVACSRVADQRPLVLAIVVLSVAATWCFTARGGSAALSSSCLVVAVTVGFVAEYVGTRTGFPFGRYEYGPGLTPQLADVPLVVPLAWFAMGLPAYAVGAAASPRADRRRWIVLRCVIGAWALTAWDLFLDPQMVFLGYWTWPDGGGYGGIPLVNFVGWFAVSVVLMVLFELVTRLRGVRDNLPLAGLYASMVVTETVGFLGPLQWRPGVAVTGAIGMGAPVAVAGWFAMRRRRG